MEKFSSVFSVDGRVETFQCLAEHINVIVSMITLFVTHQSL